MARTPRANPATTPAKANLTKILTAQEWAREQVAQSPNWSDEKFARIKAILRIGY